MFRWNTKSNVKFTFHTKRQKIWIKAFFLTHEFYLLKIRHVRCLFLLISTFPNLISKIKNNTLILGKSTISRFFYRRVIPLMINWYNLVSKNRINYYRIKTMTASNVRWLIHKVLLTSFLKIYHNLSLVPFSVIICIIINFKCIYFVYLLFIEWLANFYIDWYATWYVIQKQITLKNNFSRIFQFY